MNEYQIQRLKIEQKKLEQLEKIAIIIETKAKKQGYICWENDKK